MKEEIRKVMDELDFMMRIYNLSAKATKKRIEKYKARGVCKERIKELEKEMEISLAKKAICLKIRDLLEGIEWKNLLVFGVG